MENVRITYYGEHGSIYSVVEGRNDLSIGEWEFPFPNTKDESTATGLVECLTQSDMCPGIFFQEMINKVQVERC